MTNAGLQNSQWARLGQLSARAGCVLMTVQHRGYSGAADPKLCFYSYRPDGSAWVCVRGRDDSEMKCVEIRYWGEKALVSVRHPLDQDSETKSKNTPTSPTDAQCCPYPLGTASKPIKWGRKSIPTPALPRLFNAPSQFLGVSTSGSRGRAF